jgi:hypothetical protein
MSNTEPKGTKMTTTLKLTDAQVEAIFRAIYVHNESYAGCDDQELAGTGVRQAMRSLDAIKAKLEKQGWH